MNSRGKLYKSRKSKAYSELREHINCDFTSDGISCENPAAFSCKNNHSLCTVHVDKDVSCKSFGKKCPICGACINDDSTNRNNAL